MKKFKLISVDVWDTLLRRPCHPDANKRAAARYLLLNYYDFVRIEYRDLNKLLNLRIMIEDNISRKLSILDSKYDPEYNFELVYKEYCEYVLEVDSKVKSKVKKELIKYEYEKELNQVYKDAGIEKVLKKFKADHIVYLSDFYMPKKYLDSIIKKAELDITFSDGFVSCDLMYAKKSGKAYDYLLKKYNILPQEYLHIGDHRLFDYKIPKSKGIHSILYSPFFMHKKRIDVEDRYNNKKFFETKLKQKNIISTKSIYKIAPAIAYSIIRLDEELRKKKGTLVYFFTREGIFFQKLFDRYQKIFEINGFRPIKSRLLTINRKVSFAAAFADFDDEILDRYLNLYSDRPIEDFLKSLNIPNAIIEEIVEKCSAKNNFLNSNNKKEFIDCLKKNKINSNKIRNFLLEQKKNLMDYLKEFGFGKKDENIFIFEPGWRGSIQDNLQSVFPNLNIYGYYMILKKFLYPQKDLFQKEAFLFNENFLGAEYYFDEHHPIEMILSSDKPSLTGYQKDIHSNKIVPVFEKKMDNRNYFERYIEPYQKLILELFDFYVYEYIHQGFLGDDLKEKMVERFFNFIRKPDYFIASTYRKYTIDENFGVIIKTPIQKKFNFNFYKIIFNFIFSYNILRIESGWIEAYFRSVYGIFGLLILSIRNNLSILFHKIFYSYYVKIVIRYLIFWKSKIQIKNNRNY